MLLIAQKKIKEARELIRVNIISEKNTDGFLMGRVDDYVKEFEDFVTHADNQIEKDIQSWTTEAQILDEDKEQRLQSMQQVVDQMMKETSYLLAPAQRPSISNKQLKLTKLPIFGAKCTEKQVMFEWPRAEDLKFVRNG